MDRKFQVYEVALEAVKACRSVLERVQRSDVDLARQMRRTLCSVPLNIAEGNRRNGKDRSFHFRVAASSAAEVSAALDVARALGLAHGAAVEELLDRVRATLYRLTEPTRS